MLKDFTTFKIGGPARYFVKIKDEADLREALAFAKTRRLSVLTLGGGSNLLVSDSGYDGLVLKNEIKGIKFVDKDDDRVVVEIGAGEVWDEVVALTVTQKLSGLENLSAIPGTVGGAAVQNAGAYGAEFKDNLISVSGLNLANGKKFTYLRTQGEYSYRDSIFKKNKKLFITSVTFELSKKPKQNIEYKALKDVLGSERDLTPQKVRDAVLKIRKEKLPDWRTLGTAGSFYKNPLVTEKKYAELIENYKDLPSFPAKSGYVKIPIAWIIDNVCHLKGHRDGDVGLYEKQALVIVNYGRAQAADVINFSQKIKKIVKEKTGIEIEEEVEKIK